MTSSAHAVPWPGVVQFHREVARRPGEAFFALPVMASATERWSPLAGFEPGQLAGPWQVELDALESSHLQRDVGKGMGEAFIGGPCWFRWSSEGEQTRWLEWIPLIYREVKVENRGEHVELVPVNDGWALCPLVTRFLEQNQVRIPGSLDESLSDLLTVAQSKAAGDSHGLTRGLADAFRLVVPELAEALDQARDDFPVDRVEFVPSPWVLFTPSTKDSVITQHVLDDYAQLDRHLAAAPHAIGGLGLLEGVPGTLMSQGIEVTSIVSLDDSQRSVAEAALAGGPVTVIGGPSSEAKTQVLLSILLNAWASSKSALLAVNSNQAIDVLRQRLKALASDFEIAVYAGAEPFENIDEALGTVLDLVKASKGESHYGGSPTARKRSELMAKKQRLSGLLDSQVPQRVSQAIEEALESHAAQRKALSALASRREELVAGLRDIGIEDEPNAVDERIVDPLRKWRDGIKATHRLIEEDAQRLASLQKELSAARTERDSVLAGYEIETRPDQESSWLLIEPGFELFERALATLSEKLSEPIETDPANVVWEKAYDAWPSSEVAARWERKAREMASLIRPAGIALKEKTEELRAAREALDSAQRSVQQATKTSSLDVQKEDLDEWAACYAEHRALPRSKLAFLHKSKSAELVRQLEEIESRFRATFPPHLWTGIGPLNENGRARLSAILERAREWTSAREHWERLIPVQDEIDADTEALRRKLVALGARASSIDVTPAGCAAIASKLNAKASVAAAAAAAWSKREARERLPAEVAELAKQMRIAGAATPIKERWENGAGAALMAALDSAAADPGLKAIAAVQHVLSRSAASDPILQNWRRAHEAEKQAVAIAEEMERIPSRAARLSHWKSRQPASLPEALDVADAFDDDSHPVWAFLQQCEEWSRQWATYRDEEAPELERTASSEGGTAARRIGEAAQILPQGEEKTLLASFAGGSAVREPWPVDDITEKAARWSPERLQADLEAIDTQLEQIAFETAREQWLERITRDAEALQSLDALRDHYRHNAQRIEENGYAHFQRALKAQPVWVATGMAVQSLPMQPGLFDLLVIDEATQCTLTNMLPLIYRAKRLVVIGDPEQLPSSQGPGVETERTLAAQFGVDEWAKSFASSDIDVYSAAVGALPGGEADVISFVESK